MFNGNRWSGGRQLYWGIIIFLLFFFLTMFFYDETILFKIIVNLVMALVALAITVRATGSLRGIHVKITFSCCIIGWGLLAICSIIVMVVLSNLPITIGQVFRSNHFLLDTTAALAAAILEESLCRGLFLIGFLKIGVYRGSSCNLTRSAVYSSFLFGILHMMNMLAGHPTIVLQQIFYAFAMGVFLAALYITTNNLFWPILVHFILDWGPLVTSSDNEVSSWGIILAVFLPILIINVIYLICIDRQLAAKVL
ncbi:CPBP family intramembrane glutamic endopeptidase [Liquorilactobacillus capillatus]|uniref:Metal-dependent membrane protease n=1 Tax=Liquorilactobacillus capillatus DSM 19910 TaxID=1423731 RepID=A0A0R1M3R3_9LACO|nr:CPBP family intramembrane glutamic endopeptidase [Liquorilactobacillus capillatus]KRL02678.1 metal-dependent membrane protease [Liquorilactobacillus capillatus DSM 19910]